MSDETYLTAAGAAKLREELEALKGPARIDLAKRLRHAIQQGDLSENADYTAAKEEQGFLEGRIQELEKLLRDAVIIEETTGPRELVDVGATVTVQEEGEQPETYYIVGSKEADPRNGRISHESPIGRELLRHKVGDVITVSTPGGSLRLKIIKIE